MVLGARPLLSAAASATSLLGKVAMVTGGSSGIGASVAKSLAAQGCKVVIAARSKKGNDVAEGIIKAGGDAIFVPTDVSVQDAVKSSVEQAVKKYGGIDLLFNNAGVESSEFGQIKDQTKLIAAETKTLQVNLFGALWTFMYVIPEMVKRKGGVVVNTSSNASGNGRIAANIPAYAASKAALDSLTRNWSYLYRNVPVKVYAINPFFVATPMVGEAVNDLAKFLNPSGIATPSEDVASVVMAMFNGNTQYKTGDCVLVDTGPTTADMKVMYNIMTEVDLKSQRKLWASAIKPAMQPKL